MSAETIVAMVLAADSVNAAHKAAKQQSRALNARADWARREAAEKEGELRRRNRQVLGRHRVQLLKSGVKLEGTPLLVQSDVAAEGEIDALNARLSGELLSDQLSERARLLRRRQRGSAGRTLLTGLGRQNLPGFPDLT